MREFSPKSASRRISSVADVADIVRDRVVKFNYRIRKFARTSIDQFIGFMANDERGSFRRGLALFFPQIIREFSPLNISAK